MCRFYGILIIVAVLANAASARATTQLSVDAQQVSLLYTQATGSLVLSDNAGSRLVVLKEDTTNGILLDSAVINNGLGGDFDFLTSLTLTQNGVNDWSATGTVSLTDNDTSTSAVLAHFQSSSIQMAGGILSMGGYLTPLPQSTLMLVNRGTPWTFVGDSVLGNSGNEDGLAGQLAFANPNPYQSGTYFGYKIGAGSGSLDNLFSQDRSYSTAEALFTVVPEPMTGLLAASGFLMVGLRRKRFS